MKKEELNTETAQQAPLIKKRLLSLDALRGITALFESPDSRTPADAGVHK